MKRVAVLVSLVFLAVGLSTALLAQKAKAPSDNKPGGIVVDAVQVTAVVKSVDAAKRTVTLSLSGGESKTFKAGKDVINFDQIKVGDDVKATYVEALAIAVRGPNEPAGADEGATVTLAPKGAKPGAFLSDTQTITAKVSYIDHKTRLVTLTGPQGNSFTFNVGPNVKKLDKVKQGDTVTAVYTEDLLVKVVPAGARK